jgi:hypothetical protein
VVPNIIIYYIYKVVSPTTLAACFSFIGRWLRAYSMVDHSLYATEQTSFIGSSPSSSSSSSSFSSSFVTLNKYRPQLTTLNYQYSGESPSFLSLLSNLLQV